MDMAATMSTSEVASRELLAEGIIVSIPRPMTTKTNQAPDGAPYEQFGTPVTGGFVNFHLYDGTACAKHGKKIWVEVKVFKKTMVDGREFIYFDLFPTELRPTHVRKIYAQRAEVPKDLPAETLQFETLGPIQGTIAFVPVRFYAD